MKLTMLYEEIENEGILDFLKRGKKKPPLTGGHRAVDKAASAKRRKRALKLAKNFNKDDPRLAAFAHGLEGARKVPGAKPASQ